jgi:hypothetical protein
MKRMLAAVLSCGLSMPLAQAALVDKRDGTPLVRDAWQWSALRHEWQSADELRLQQLQPVTVHECAVRC